MYDQLGRITSMPTENGTKTATTSYFVNDLVATQEVPGTKRTQWGLDPLMRFDTQDTFEWVNNAWANSTETINHYDGDGDEPSWIVNDATLPDNLTRYVEGMDGALAVQTGKTGERVLQLVDLHGDITATLPIADGATTATFTELRFTSFDEFGIPQPMTSGATSNAPPARYGWLGAAQRNADTPAGVILMGVRLYHPATGRFLSVDPVAGGSANNYDYCNADPVNCTDLGGTWTLKGLVQGIAKVGEAAAWIPGPIGAAAAGVSAVAYAASGNKGKALEMGVVAALQTVGAGVAALAAFKVAKIAANAGKIGREFKSTRALGMEAHKKFDTYVVKKIGGTKASTYIKCGGRRCKPDGYLPGGGPIELKPHNSRAIARGIVQLKKYEVAVGKKGQLWTYRQTRILKRIVFKRHT